MSAVEDMDRNLGFVLSKLAEAADHLGEAQRRMEESSTGLCVLIGTNDDEVRQSLTYHEEGGDQLAHAAEVLRRCTDQITRYRTGVATTSTTGTPPPERPARSGGGSPLSPPRGWGAVEGEKPNQASISAESRRTYILDGDGRGGGGHCAGTGLPNKSEFPANWEDNKIISSIEDVAKNPDSPPELQDNGLWKAEGTRDGVVVRAVVDRTGRIVTGHPVGGHGVIHNDATGNPR